MYYTYSANPLQIPLTISDDFGNTIQESLDTSTFTFTFTTPDAQKYTYTFGGGTTPAVVTNPDGTKKQYVYENSSFPNKPTGYYDEDGHRLHTWAYDSSGRVILSQTGVIGSGGALSQYSFSYGTNTVTVTDPLGTVRTLTYQNDSYGNPVLVSTSLPCNECGPNIQSKVLNSSGQMIQSTDFLGNATQYGWDTANALMTSITPPGQPTTTTSWNVGFREPTQVNEPGRTTAFSYDSKGNVTQEVVTDTTTGKSQTWVYTNSAFGQVLTATDPDGNTTTYTYDSGGNLASVTDALKHMTSYQNNADGKVTQKTDPNGLITKYSYDVRGHLTVKLVGNQQYSFGYDAAGNLTSVSAPSGYSVIMAYDAADRLTGITDNSGNQIQYTLDGMGNHLTEKRYSASNTLVYSHSWAFDSLNRLAQDVGASGQTTTNQYDGNSNLLSVTDPLNHITQNVYDALNRLTQTIAADNSSTSYAYNNLNQLNSVTDPRRLVTRYTIDALGNNLQLSSPDTGTSTSTSDAAGNVVSHTDAKGQNLLYQYDALNRKTQIKRADTGQVLASITYDQNDSAHGSGIGHPTSMTDLSGSTNWSYDQYGHVVSKSTQIGGQTLTTVYAYNGTTGNLQSMTLPAGNVVGYTWTNGRISALTLNSKPLVSNISYEPFSGPLGWALANGESDTRGYDLDGRITDDPVETISYDAASRVTGWTQSFSSALGGTQTFSYDNQDRVTSYSGTGGPITYTYDANGNRLTQDVNGSTTTYTIDPASNRVTQRSVPGLLGPTNTNLGYDANGSITAFGAANLTYNVQGQLSNFSAGLAAGIYSYNGLGQRAEKQAGLNTIFSYDESSHLIGEYGTNGSLNDEIIYLGDMPVAVARQGSTYFVHADYRNAPRQVDNSSKAAVWEWEPTPFGDNQPNQQPSLLTAAFGFSLRFPGQYYDGESTLSKNVNRDYFANMGRYIESDPIGLDGGINTYVYTDSSPLNAVDEDGFSPIKLIKLCAKGYKVIREITKSEAVQIVKKGAGDIKASHKDGREIARLASQGKKPIRDPIHPGKDGSTEGRMPHYHPNPRTGSHIFYSVAAALTLSHYAPCTDCIPASLLEIGDFFNPLSAPQDTIDTYNLLTENEGGDGE